MILKSNRKLPPWLIGAPITIRNSGSGRYRNDGTNRDRAAHVAVVRARIPAEPASIVVEIARRQRPRSAACMKIRVVAIP